MLEEGKSIDTIYLDFGKAFDTVPHERLFCKLDGLGAQGKILGWIRNFLSDRTQKVIIHGEESGWRDVISGIPQGSVQSPRPNAIMCFISDLPQNVKTNVFMFTDDTKLFATVPENKCSFTAGPKQLAGMVEEVATPFQHHKMQSNAFRESGRAE